MSFFTLSDGNAATSDGNMDMGGGSFDPIPKDTNVLAAITETKIDSYEGERYINNAWTVLAPAEYKNRKIFQKLRVYDADPAKKDKAIRMLAAIDANCGGKLVASGKEPTDALLTQCLLNKPMICNLQVWDIQTNQEECKRNPDAVPVFKSGNWISKVSPRKAQQEAAPAPVPTENASNGGGMAMEDDIPFAPVCRHYI